MSDDRHGEVAHEVRVGIQLPRQIAGFFAALVLIIVVSHFLGGAAGRRFGRQDSVSVARGRTAEWRSTDSEATTVATKVQIFEAQLAVWRMRIDELVAGAERAGPQTRFKTRQRIDDLKAKCAITQARIEKLKPARP